MEFGRTEWIRGDSSSHEGRGCTFDEGIFADEVKYCAGAGISQKRRGSKKRGK